MSFKYGRIDGNKITLDWSGMWVGALEALSKESWSTPSALKAAALIFANDWWAEKL